MLALKFTLEMQMDYPILNSILFVYRCVQNWHNIKFLIREMNDPFFQVDKLQLR